jgi:hypothetical protein
MYELTVDNPNLGKNAKVQIPGLGTFENGQTYTVSKEEADRFRVYQKSVGMPDRTLLQAFQKNDYVTVEVAKEEPKPKQGDNKKEGDQ